MERNREFSVHIFRVWGSGPNPHQPTDPLGWIVLRESEVKNSQENSWGFWVRSCLAKGCLQPLLCPPILPTMPSHDVHQKLGIYETFNKCWLLGLLPVTLCPFGGHRRRGRSGACRLRPPRDQSVGATSSVWDRAVNNQPQVKNARLFHFFPDTRIIPASQSKEELFRKIRPQLPQRENMFSV